MTILRRTLIALGLTFAASAAVAADGVLEINAACVADGCFTGDSPGFPVTVGQAGSSYVLTSDLEVPDADTGAIRSVADNVTIDLNGFTVSGPTTCTGEPVTSCSPIGSGNGIYLAQRNRLINGQVTGFGDIGVYASPHSFVKNLTVTNNGGNGTDGYEYTIVDSVASLNGEAGFSFRRANGVGDLFRSQAHGNGQAGVELGSGVLRDNRITDNAGVAVLGVASGDFGYAGNYMDGNNSDGTQISTGIAVGCNVIQGARSCPP